jgi:hypothetical protein
VLVPSHTSETGSHVPTDGLHDVPAVAAVSAGHAALLPSQTSDTGSHRPIDMRQTVPADDFASAGHAVLEPSHFSAGSHAPAVFRQMVFDAAVTVAHVPLLGAPAAVLHAWQSVVTPPPHAELQQMLSTQLPEVHWVPAVHAAPLA